MREASSAYVPQCLLEGYGEPQGSLGKDVRSTLRIKKDCTLVIIAISLHHVATNTKLGKSFTLKRALNTDFCVLCTS